ncbi:hypothetical protein JOB18_047660 [Solea senegalensis]|uniref:Niban 1/2/3 domain-containing protein n=1 Tax=Solea senegalensis TaxID=28829 RepID=A0AAV6QRI9_SOLSE|nr:hypothetical protein JOB18_047660 [Solea senegalensis]
MLKNLEHMEKISMLAFHPVKMHSCYEKVVNLSLEGLQQQFDVSSPSVFVQSAQIPMRELRGGGGGGGEKRDVTGREREREMEKRRKGLWFVKRQRRRASFHPCSRLSPRVAGEAVHDNTFTHPEEIRFRGKSTPQTADL